MPPKEMPKEEKVTAQWVWADNRWLLELSTGHLVNCGPTGLVGKNVEEEAVAAFDLVEEIRLPDGTIIS
jgi:hypothetical protein